MEGIILSSWDYVMGPQLERLWIRNSESKFSWIDVPTNVLRDFNVSKISQKNDSKDEFIYRSNLSLYSFMCGQLLLGEIDASEAIGEITSRTYISDLKLLIGVIFRIKAWISVGTVKEVRNVCLCIGIVYKRNVFNFILKNQSAIDIYLRKMASFLQKSKPPSESVIDEFASFVLSVMPNLDSFCHNVNHIQNYIVSTFQDYSLSGVLPKTIISHLQTSCRTVVLGGSEFKIKQIINVLTLFNNNEDISYSFCVNPQLPVSKISKLCIQGIIKNSEKDCEHLLEQAFNESLPLTVIDTDLSRILQTYPFISNIENSRIFSSVFEAGQIIPELLSNLSFADKNYIDCYAIIKTFNKQLVIKANALVKTIMHFRNIKRILSKQELMTLFSIHTIVDIQVLLGCAEIIKPRIRSLLL